MENKTITDYTFVQRGQTIEGASEISRNMRMNNIFIQQSYGCIRA